MNGPLTAAVTGFALGWSVAWPPGPVNAEIVRRGLSRGFLAAVAVGLGASTGDFIWALAIGLGAGTVAELPAMARLLSAVSTVLLLGLAAHYAMSAVRVWRHLSQQAAPSPAASLRGGYALGLTLALTSPFNIAFWLAVVGRPEIAAGGTSLVLVTAMAVIVGTVAWVLTLATSVVVLHARYQTPAWDVATRAVTAVLLLLFAARPLWG